MSAAELMDGETAALPQERTGKARAKRQRRPAKVPLPPPGRMAVSLDEAAALTGLCVNSIRRAVKIGKLKVRHFGARVIVRRADLDAFLSGLPEGLQTRPSAE